MFLHFIFLLNSTSFGVPFFSYTSFKKYHIKPIWKNETRSKVLNTKRPEQEEKISMQWRKN
jgi:hypothetical protein